MLVCTCNPLQAIIYINWHLVTSINEISASQTHTDTHRRRLCCVISWKQSFSILQLYKFKQLVYIDTSVAAYRTTVSTRPSRNSSKRSQYKNRPLHIGHNTSPFKTHQLLYAPPALTTNGFWHALFCVPFSSKNRRPILLSNRNRVCSL